MQLELKSGPPQRRLLILLTCRRAAEEFVPDFTKR